MQSPLPVSTYLNAQLKLAVPVNGVFVAFKDLDRAVRRFCVPALFRLEDLSPQLYYKSGSAVCLRFRGRNFCLITRHQLGREPSRLNPRQFVLSFEGNPGSPYPIVGVAPQASAEVRIREAGYQNLEDLIVMEFEDERSGRDLRHLFLRQDLQDRLETIPAPSIQTVMSIGFPTSATTSDCDVDEDGILNTTALLMRWVKVHYELAEPALMDVEN